MKLSEYISKFDEELTKGLSSLEKNLGLKIEDLGEKAENLIKKTDDYFEEQIDYAKKEWKKLNPEVRSDIKKGTIGAGIAALAPLYIAIPAGVYAYTKARKFLKLKKSYPKKE